METSNPRGTITAGRSLWFALAIALMVAGIFSYRLTFHWMPPFVYAALAAVVAGLLVRSLVNSLVHFVQCYREEGQLQVLPLALNVVAVIFLVVLPFTRFLVVMGVLGGGSPRILSGFGDWLGGEGYPRAEGLHRGLDVAGSRGTPVLAAADGRIVVATDNGDACGLIVVIDHRPHGYRTIYCHLSELSVKRGEDVKRGQPIGVIGMTGQRAWPRYEHVHWELRTGDRHEDPVPRTTGCFDATRQYPADRLVLTYPVKC